jgi:hypothetical protein
MTGLILSGNRTEEATMRFLRRRDLMNHQTDNLKVEPESSYKRTTPFFEDFNMEHSSSFRVGTRMAATSGSGADESKAQGRRQTQNQRSPSCVYLG